jgi:hypothetical protein
MRPSALRSALLLAVAACSTPAPPAATAVPPADAAQSALAAEVKAVSAKAEALLHSQDELVWKSWTEGTSADLAKTYAGAEVWLTPASTASVQRARQSSTDASERRALTHLHAYLVTEWLAQKTSELSEEAAKLEQTLTFGPPGQERPYRNLEVLLASERSSLRRRSLYDSATPAVVKLGEVLAQRRLRTEALLAELGLSSAALTVELRDSEVEPLVALANEVLARTQSAFSATLGRLSWTELQLPVEQVSRADVPRLFRLQAQDAAFPKAEIYARATRTLLGVGVDLAAMKNVTVDLKETPGKNPHGLVLGVVVPTDVRVSLLPIGGARDERETLHQMGHVLRDSLTQERRWELAKLGNRTVGEAWSFLMEDLTLDPGWLERVAGLSGDAQVGWRTSAAAQRLFLLRRAAGKLLFNAEARAPGANVPDIYREVMARTYGFPMTPADEARAELDREEFLAAADFLQAFLLAAELEQQLRGRFGVTWWQQTAAGDWMRRLLAPGTRVSAEGLAHALGEERINIEAFMARLPATLGGGAPSVPANPVPAGESVPPPRAADGGMRLPTETDAGAPPAPGPDFGATLADPPPTPS